MSRFLFLFFSIFFLCLTSCSSDDGYGDKGSHQTPYIIVEDTCIAPYEFMSTKQLKVKSSEKFEAINTNDSDWFRLVNFPEGGDSATVYVHCEENRSPKERKSVITIKTPSLSKEVILIQQGNLEGDFAILKSSTLYADEYWGNLRPEKSGSVKSFWWKTQYANKLDCLYPQGIHPEISVPLCFLDRYFDTARWMTIYLTTNQFISIEGLQEAFLNPYFICYENNPYKEEITNSNITTENFRASKSGNIITYHFTNFKSPCGGRSQTYYNVINGTLEFELIEE